MKLLLGLILMITSFGAIAACSETSPGECTTQEQCKGLPNTVVAKWDGKTCLVSTAQTANTKCVDIDTSTKPKDNNNGVQVDPSKKEAQGQAH